MSYLTIARDQRSIWSLDEGGQHYIDGQIDTRVGSHYFGSATLVAIDGVAAPIPEPETYTMILAGLGLVGVAALRRKKTKV